MSEQTKALLLREIPKMNGWISPERAVQMYEIVLALQPEVIVEIGVFAGRSLIAQAIGLKENKHGRIYGIDPWKAQACLEGQSEQKHIDWWSAVNLHQIHNECVDSIWRFGVQSHVVLLQAGSQDCHQIIPQTDMMYIDGNHSEIASCRDVRLYLPKLKQNGFL
jgi:hypothetical protein